MTLISNKYPSRFNVTREGRQVLVVSYDNEKRDWNDAIAWAVKHHKLTETVQTIALPEDLFIEWAPKAHGRHTVTAGR